MTSEAEDKAAFEAVMKTFPPSMGGELEEMWNLALSRRDAQVAQVNQQMLEALKLLSHCMTLAGWENDWANTKAKTAIAAAEALKGK